MLNIDKWPWLVQLIAGLGVFVGGALAAIFGNRFAGKKSSDDDRQRDESDRVERSKRYQIERELELERLEKRFEIVIQALRESILGKLEEQQECLREDFKAFNIRVTATERDIAVILARRQR